MSQRKSVTNLIRAYGEVNPNAVVRLMQQYQDIEEKKAAEEKEEIMANAQILGDLGSGAMENLQDFRTAQAGGYKGGYFKFMTEKPENIATFMEEGQTAIDNAEGREKELMTALFPKAKQKHFDRIDKKAEKYGVTGEEWEKLTFKERKKLKNEYKSKNKDVPSDDSKDVEDGKDVVNVENNESEILFHEDATPPETDYSGLSYNENQAKVAQSYIDKDWLPDSNVNKDAYLALGGKYEPEGGWDVGLDKTDSDPINTDIDKNIDTSFLNQDNIDSFKLDAPSGFNASNSDTTNMFNTFDKDLTLEIPEIKLEEFNVDDIISEDVADLKFDEIDLDRSGTGGGIVAGIKSLFGFG